MGRAQDAINKVTLATNRAAQAAKTGRVSAELQRTQNEKLTASYNLAATRLDMFRDRVQAQAQSLGAAQRKQFDLARQIAETSALLQQQTDTWNRLKASGKGNAGLFKILEDAIAKTTMRLSELTGEQAATNKQVAAGTNKEKLYQAQLKAREARLDAQAAKLKEVQKPLSRFESFLATMIQLNNAVNKVGTTWEKWTKNIERTLRIIEKVKNFVGGKGAVTNSEVLASQSPTGLTGGVQNVLQRVQGGFSVLGQIAAHVIGDIIVGGLRTAVSGFINLAQAAVGSVASFERLNLSFKALLAVQKTNADNSLSLNDALQLSGAEAAKLLRWLEKLAIISPFRAEEVQNAFRNAMAMGFNTQEAARLTKATLDWAAATGKSGAEAEHAVYVMGQMRSAGKLLYQDLYQLAQLGIGMDQINRALAETLGKSVEEIKRMREAGQITAAQGITAITTYMEKFSGAAAAQAHTLDGLISSLQDIGPIFLRSFFGPLNMATGQVEGFLGVIRKRLDGFVSFLQNEWVIKNTAVLGRAFGNWTEKAFTWGEKLVKQYANGIIAGTFALLDALANIGKIISYWLMPHSPPKIVPHIDEWGMATMQEYFNGFKRADMSVFSDIGQTIEQVLRSSVTTNESDRLGILERIFGSRQAIGELTDMLRLTGSVTEAMFQKVFDAMGGPTQAVQNYLRAYVALTQQNQKVKAAQDEVNRVTKYYQDLLKPVNQEINRITEAQQDLVDAQQKRMLEMVLNDPNATAAEKAQAALEIEKLAANKRQRLLQAEGETAVQAAQDKLDAETLRQQQLADEVELQQQLIEAQTQQNSLVQEYLDLVKSLAEKGSGAGGGGGPELPTGTGGLGAGFEIPDLAEKVDIELEKLRAKFEQKIAVLRSIWRELWYLHILPLFKPFQEAWGKVQTAWDKLMTAINEDSPMIQETIGKVIAEIIKFSAQEGPKILGIITRIIETMTRIWKKHGETIIKVIGAIVIGGFAGIVLVLEVILTIIEWTLNLIEGLMDAGSKAIQLAMTNPLLLAGKIIGGILQTIFFFFYSMGMAVLTILNVWAGGVASIIATVVGIWQALKDSVFEIVKGWISDLMTKVLELRLSFWTHFNLIKTQVTTKFIELKIAAIEKIKELLSTLKERLADIKQEFTDRFTEAKDKVAEVVQGVYEAVTGKVAEIITTLTSPETIASFLQIGKDFVQGIIDGITGMAGSLATAIANMVSGMFGTAEKEGEQHSPSRRAAREVGKPFVQGIQMGIKQELGALRSSVVGTMNTMIAPPATAAQIGSSNVTTTNTKNMTYAPTYNTVAPPPPQDWAIMEVWAR